MIWNYLKFNLENTPQLTTVVIPAYKTKINARKAIMRKIASTSKIRIRPTMLSCSVDKLTPSIRIKRTLKMNYRWKVEEMILIMMMDLGNSKIIHTTITIINSISSSMGISEHNRLKSQKLIILSSWLQMSLNSINYSSLRMMKISSVISMKLPKKVKKMIRIRILLVLLLLSLQSRIISVTQMRK
jgi:hypothetical protein